MALFSQNELKKKLVCVNMNFKDLLHFFAHFFDIICYGRTHLQLEEFYENCVNCTEESEVLEY